MRDQHRSKVGKPAAERVLASDCLRSSARLSSFGSVQTGADRIETTVPDKQAPDAREDRRDGSAPPARTFKRYAAGQTAAAAQFEQLKARLRRMVGTNKTER